MDKQKNVHLKLDEKTFNRAKVKLARDGMTWQELLETYVLKFLDKQSQKPN